MQNYLWVKDPFKEEDRPVDIIITDEENFTDGFRFHSATNVLCLGVTEKENSTTVWKGN